MFLKVIQTQTANSFLRIYLNGHFVYKYLLHFTRVKLSVFIIYIYIEDFDNGYFYQNNWISLKAYFNLNNVPVFKNKIFNTTPK